MAQKVKICFDPEGDFLEVLFSDKPGFIRDTNNDAVMERVDNVRWTPLSRPIFLNL